MFYVSFPGLGIIDLAINRVAFTVGSMPVYWYGVIIASGMLLAVLFAYYNAKKFGIDADRMLDVIMLGIVAGVVCARLYYVAFQIENYHSLWDVINVRDGGLAIYGGVLGAFGIGCLLCKWRKIKILPMFDLTAMGFLIGQGIGRWGNFFNQEAFGSNTTMPWGMYSDGTHNYLAAMQETLAQQGIIVDPSMPVHPTFFYESVWCLAGFFLLAWYMKKRRFDGEITLLYGIWYGAERAVVEGLRTDSLMWGSFRVSQMLAIVIVIVCSVLWVLGYKRAQRLLAQGIDPVSREAVPVQPAQDSNEVQLQTDAKADNTTEALPAEENLKDADAKAEKDDTAE
ncbi:MAG: prolipoprotein diacylglyceryl transferase [Oscillospiraceae bacterium]|nr:prolipoprotein diacylglyceryl transferase [Oscillospiraceae bacterium]